MMSSLLESGVVLSDANLNAVSNVQQAKAAKLSLAWCSLAALLNSASASALATSVYLFYYAIDAPAPKIGTNSHMLTGMLLGLLLVSRCVYGLHLVHKASSALQKFMNISRTLAVFSSYVCETLTISAGAELEKKAISTFRFELVRLLNLAFYCHQCMLKGLKVHMPPPSLVAGEGGKMEAEILSAVDNPTIMVAKLIASLVEQQRAAKRISNEQVGVIMTKLSDLIDAYSSSLAIAIAPAPVALSAFASFFTFVWVFTVCPIIALLEVDKATPTPAAFVLTIASTFFTALFFFGLFEAGNVVEAPLKTVLALTAVDNMCFSLSDDLSSLVDDPDQRVPVFMPRPAR